MRRSDARQQDRKLERISLPEHELQEHRMLRLEHLVHLLLHFRRFIAPALDLLEDPLAYHEGVDKVGIDFLEHLGDLDRFLPQRFDIYALARAAALAPAAATSAIRTLILLIL